MEIFTLYNFVSAIFLFSNVEPSRALLLGLIFGGILFLALFLLQGFGLRTMAKKRGIKKSWLAFVPFASIFFIGKLTGPCDVFGQKVKRAGLYTMIAQILTSVMCALTVASQLYLYVNCGAPQYDNYGSAYWTGLSGFSLTVANFYEISGYVLSILQLIYEILMLILLLGLYKKYYPKNYFILGVLELFVPVSRFVVIFVLRNRKAIDYEAYVRARREAYMRRQQQYRGYGNPYGTPYGYGQNPYGNPQNGRPQQPEDPFSEFGTDKKPDGEDRGGNQNKGGDDASENPFDDF